MWHDKRWQMTAWRSARACPRQPQVVVSDADNSSCCCSSRCRSLALASPRGDEASARAALLARFDAALHADVAALDKLLADDLEYCGVSATCSTKAQYLESIRSGTRKFRSLEPKVERVTLFADSAVLTGKVYAVSIGDGTERNVNAYFLVVLAWRDGRWQMTNQSSTLLEPKPTAMSHPRRKTLPVHVGRVTVGGPAPIVIQSMTNTDTADIEGTAQQIKALARAGSELVRITVNEASAAAAVAPIRDRLAQMGVGVPIIGDFHFNGHKLLREHPECADALAKYRINPGNVGRGSKRDPQFAEMIEFACRYEKPVRIGVNWGSLDQDLLTRMMDENNSRARAAVGAGNHARGGGRFRARERRARRGAGPAARAHHPLGEGQRRAGPHRYLPPPRASAATTRCTSASPKPAWAARASSPPPPAWRCCCRKASATPSAYRSRPNPTAIAPTK